MKIPDFMVNTITWDKIEKKKLYYVYILLAIVIIAFNLIAVFGLDVLINDDQSRYIYYSEYLFKWTGKQRNFLVPIYQFIFANVMVFSPELSRAMVLVLLMVPISWLFFTLLIKYFSLPLFLSFTISCIVPLLPNQLMYPAFVDGSYVLVSLLFFLISLIYGLKYLSGQASIKNYFFSVLAFIISAMMSEMIVFLTVPACFLYIFTFYRFRKYLLIISTGAISLFKFIESLLNQYAASKIVNLELINTVERIKISFVFINPFNIQQNHSISYIFAGLIVFIIVIGIFISFTSPPPSLSFNKTFNIKNKYSVLFILAFSFIWFLSTSITFYTASPFFSSRYFYIPAYGFNMLLILSLYIILVKYLPGMKALIFIILTSVLLYSGFNKVLNFNHFRLNQNKYFNFYKKEFKKHEFPLHSQIVITGKSAALTDGWWHWSSGYLRFLLKRNDISGIMPHHYSYYDPFDGKTGRVYKTKMTGLSLNDPIFLFRSDNKFIQKKYALQWKDKHSKDSDWIIYNFDKLNGHTSPFIKGKGFYEYKSVIDSLTIDGTVRQEDIMFGAAPKKTDSIRLGL